MFTGIIEEIGNITAIRKGTHSSHLTIEADLILEGTKIGDSIAVNGVCLTVTSMSGKNFTADVMHETLDRSTMAKLTHGSPVNLERAMPMGGRFGGHIVSGHIDGVGQIRSILRDDNATVYTIEADSSILRYIIRKGSITIDGISLTVKDVTDRDFSVSIIPHTKMQTTLSRRQIGDNVNIENDCIGKYIEKLMAPTSDQTSGGLSREFLLQHGF